MMKPKRKWPVIVGSLLMVGFVAWMVYSSRPGNTARFHCEVCMTFDGRTACHNAAGMTQTEAQRVATEGACSDLTSGMNNLEHCRNSDPKVTWRQ